MFPDEARQDVSGWLFVDGKTYHWFHGQWRQVEFFGGGANQYRHIS